MFVFDRGLWRGALHLIVVPPNPDDRAYGIEVPCECYAGFEEMIYSVTPHGDTTANYRGDTYIKEAKQSALITAFVENDPFQRKPRHYLFVGGDYCYEVLSLSEPVVHALANRDDAYEWQPWK